MQAPPGNPIRILLVDQNTLVREGLRLLIENNGHMAVVAEAGNGCDALAIAVTEQPDVILLDINHAMEDDLRLIRRLIEVARDARIIALTDTDDEDAHHNAVRLGAMGLVFKDQPANVLLKAIERVHAGEAWLDRSMTASLLSEMAHTVGQRADPNAERIGSLTERELQVVGLIAQGFKNKRIGERLFISEATVRNHLTSILSKLDLSDRFQLALFAYRHHLAKPPC
jgi:DNA-binding NarL/FixJ family response regulator